MLPYQLHWDEKFKNKLLILINAGLKGYCSLVNYINTLTHKKRSTCIYFNPTNSIITKHANLNISPLFFSFFLLKKKKLFMSNMQISLSLNILIILSTHNSISLKKMELQLHLQFRQTTQIHEVNHAICIAKCLYNLVNNIKHCKSLNKIIFFNPWTLNNIWPKIQQWKDHMFIYLYHPKE